MTKTSYDMTNETPAELAEFSGRHPSTQAILRAFTYGHLPEHLQAISKPVCELAFDMVRRLPDDPELVTGLRKLREGKDCLVLTRVLNPDGSADG